MNPHTLQDLAALVGQADCALVAATSGRGIDGHGHRLPDLDANLDRALAALVDAGRIAEAMRDDRRANDCDAPAGIVERLRAMPICYGNPTDRVLAGLVGCTPASVRDR